MGLQFRWLSLLACFYALPAWAEDWKRDVWHFVTEDSPFFSEDRRNTPAAGLLQSDGRFAFFVLGTEEQGALISVNLPGELPAEQIISTLVMGNGTILTRKLEGVQLVAQVTPDGHSVTYSFRVPPEDLESFMAAHEWRLKTGDAEISLTLKGTRDAVSAALAARETAQLLRLGAPL